MSKDLEKMADTNLLPDIWIEIFSLLKSATDMARLGMTCRFLYGLLNKNSTTIFKKAAINFSEYKEYENLPKQQQPLHWQFFCKIQNDKTILRIDQLPALPSSITSMNTLDVVLFGNAQNSQGSSIKTLLTLNLDSPHKINLEAYTTCNLSNVTLRIWNTAGQEKFFNLLKELLKDKQIAIVIPDSQNDLDTQLDNLKKLSNKDMAVFIVYLNESLKLKNLQSDEKDRIILLKDDMLNDPKLLFNQIIQRLQKNQPAIKNDNHHSRICILQ